MESILKVQLDSNGFIIKNKKTRLSSSQQMESILKVQLDSNGLCTKIAAAA